MSPLRGLCATILIAFTCSCVAPAAESGLVTSPRVEEHLLLEAPSLDPLVFKPAQGTMESVLAAHAAEREQIITPESLVTDGHFSLRAMLGQDTLVATENYSADGSTGWVTLERNGVEIFRIDTGMASPVTALRGLWTYDGHWVLETADISSETIGGRMTRDGIVLNDEMGYADAFGFQLLDGRPFYFFARGGRIGYSYDGRESMPAYDDIPHYGCCSAAELNPRQAQGMVAFFARRSGAWYYVEISSGD